VTLDEVRQAIYDDRVAANAGHVVHAARRFGLEGRGLAVEQPAQLAHLATPNIAHVMADRGDFPRPRDRRLDGHFVVVASISPHRVRWIDPYDGPIERAPIEFLEIASGTFLVFDEARP
jgi:ABC-type bacteriocin/lantibiotic exporter with double-glycine peptidase domain